MADPHITMSRVHEHSPGFISVETAEPSEDILLMIEKTSLFKKLVSRIGQDAALDVVLNRAKVEK